MWHAVVAGFGGMRDYGDTLIFAPRLPSRLVGLSFGLLYRDRRLRVRVQADHATYDAGGTVRFQKVYIVRRYRSGPVDCG